MDMRDDSAAGGILSLNPPSQKIKAAAGCQKLTWHTRWNVLHIRLDSFHISIRAHKSVWKEGGGGLQGDRTLRSDSKWTN